jgi:hypothetical protein
VITTYSRKLLSNNNEAIGGQNNMLHEGPIITIVLNVESRDVTELLTNDQTGVHDEQCKCD